MKKIFDIKINDLVNNDFESNLGNGCQLNLETQEIVINVYEYLSELYKSSDKFYML